MTTPSFATDRARHRLKKNVTHGISAHVRGGILRNEDAAAGAEGYKWRETPRRRRNN